MRNAGSLTDFQWLLSPEAAPWLELAANELEPSVGAIARLRKELSAERVHLVLQQAALRHRARDKFAAAERMFFSPLGLEQATDEVIARHKAQRFAERLGSGRGPVADLCCGIGGDLMALAGAGRRSALIAIQLQCCWRKRIWLLVDCRTVRCKPPNWQRSPSPNSPPGTSIPTAGPRGIERHESCCTIRHQPRSNVFSPNVLTAAVKLAPAAMLPDGWELRAELEWISSRRECRQLVAWFGDLAADRAGTRRATVLSRTNEPRSFVGQSDIPVPVAANIGCYVFEPDAAVLAAGLCGALAAECGLEAVTAQAAYLTGEAAATVLQDAALSCFEVLEVMPLRIKALRQWLRDRGFGRVEVKKRGVDVDPQRLAAELHGSGEDRATLLIFRKREKTTTIIARRCPALESAVDPAPRAP